jgi:hypothetical protein
VVVELKLVVSCQLHLPLIVHHTVSRRPDKGKGTASGRPDKGRPDISEELAYLKKRLAALEGNSEQQEVTLSDWGEEAGPS